MHPEVLSKNQVGLLPLVGKFMGDFGLVGGTALALQLGHRRSIDFDLFSNRSFNGEKIRNRLRREFPIEQTLVESPDELTVVINNVKITFYRYPFPIDFSLNFESTVKIPEVKIIAAMKAFALGRRAKWKDYVDLYFVFKKHGLSEIVGEAKRIFAAEFNEKLFRTQLAYFDDIDYSEQVEYLPNFKTDDSTIKEFLREASLSK